jgi:hypothetical protein
VVLTAGLLGLPAGVAGEEAPFCQPGEAPTFVAGFATLQGQLGPTMADPTECEHGQPATADVLQRPRPDWPTIARP